MHYSWVVVISIDTIRKTNVLFCRLDTWYEQWEEEKEEEEKKRRWLTF